MRYKLTILNACTALFMIGLLVYTLYHYERLSDDEGWGTTAMLGLAGLGIMGGLMDLLLQALLKHEGTINIIGSFIVVTLGMVVVLS